MIEMLFYLIGIIGILVLFSADIHMLYCRFRNRFLIRRNLKSIGLANKFDRYGKIGRHIYKVIDGAGMLEFYKSVEQFVSISITIFILSAFIFTSFFDIKVAIFSSLFLAAVPYMICIIKLNGRRSLGSREGDILVYELLNNYRIQSFNMKAAIECCALTIEGAPVSKNVLMNLSKELNLAATEEEINKALESFKYAFDTAWGNILASNMFLAIFRGVNVEKSLEILSQGISKGRQVIEYERRQNFEATLMLKFLVPMCYILSLIASIAFFDIRLGEFVYYQFGTSIGLKWFILMSVTYFIAFCIAKIASSEKMDI